MKARYCGVVVGLFLQALGAQAFAAPGVNGVATTVNPGVPGTVAAPAAAPIARVVSAPAIPVQRQAPNAQVAPAAIAPAALTADGAELEDESGMFAGSESQVLSVVPSQDVAPAPATQRSWLRQSRDAKGPSIEETKESGVSLSVVAFLLLGALAGGAIFMRFKRPGANPGCRQPRPCPFDDQNWPQVPLVTADIYGRVMLLGVTEFGYRTRLD